MSDRDDLSPRSLGLWLAVVGLLVSAQVLAPRAALLGQEEKDEDDAAGRQDPYDPIVELRKYEYIASSPKTKKKAIQFTFNVHPDIPQGAKINFELEYNALPFESVNYSLEGRNRRGLVFEWSPKKELAVDQYYLRVRLYLNDQTPAVKKAMERSRKFPKDLEPWPWLYFNQPIQIGTKAELQAQMDEMCDLYGKYMDRLVANYGEFQELVEKVKAGEVAVNGTKLDEKKFEELIVAWRKKQGQLQQEIQDLVIEKPVFATKSPTAYRYLSDLGRMVSKAALSSQKEVTDQYGVGEIRPKKPAHRYFNAVYRYAAGKKQLNDTLGRIEGIVCAHLLEQPAEGDPASKEGDAKKGDAKKDDSEKGDTEKDAKEDASKEGDAKKADAKKDSSKRKSSSKRK